MIGLRVSGSKATPLIGWFQADDRVRPSLADIGHSDFQSSDAINYIATEGG